MMPDDAFFQTFCTVNIGFYCDIFISRYWVLVSFLDIASQCLRGITPVQYIHIPTYCSAWNPALNIMYIHVITRHLLCSFPCFIHDIENFENNYYKLSISHFSVCSILSRVFLRQINRSTFFDDDSPECFCTFIYQRFYIAF